MKFVKNLCSFLLAAIGLGAAAAAIFLSMNFVDAKPILLTPPDVARSKVIMLMNAVTEGNYEEASQTIYGTPNLGVDREAGDPVGVMIWEAFEGSVTYELVGDCYTTDLGLAQDLTVTCMDVTSVTANLKERSQTLLEQRVAEAEDISEIYDEKNEYREDVVMEVLRDAIQEALTEDVKTMTVDLTVNLSYQDGKWWIVADEALYHVISGGILY